MIGQFVVKKNKNQSICAAPVMIPGSIKDPGFVILYGSKIQRIELESNTFSNCFLTIYDSKKMRKRKHHWFLSDVFVTVDVKNQKFTAQYGNQDDLLNIVIPCVDDFRALYYLLSRNRELTEAEQLQRVKARYPSDKHIERAFTKLVINRVMPHERETYKQLPFIEKVMTLCKYGELVAVKSLSDYIYSLRSPNLGKEIAFLTGAIIDEDSDWVAAFIEELGVKILTDNVLNARGRRADFWEISQCALECMHALVNKQLPSDSISSLQYVVDNPDCIFFIVTNFEHPFRICRQLVFQLVQVLIYHCAESSDEDGFENIIDSMEAFAREKKYSSRWDIFSIEMNKELQQPEVDIGYLATIVSLVNLIIGQPYFSNEERVDIWRKLDSIGFQGLLEEIGIDEDSLNQVQSSGEMQFTGDLGEWLDAAQAHTILKEQDEKSIPDLNEIFSRIHQECKDNGTIFELVKLLSLFEKIPADLPAIWRMYNDALETTSTRSRHSVCNEQPLAIFEDYDQLKNMGDTGRRLSTEEVQTQMAFLEKTNKKLQRQVENLRSENRRLSGEFPELISEAREASPPRNVSIQRLKDADRDRADSFGSVKLNLGETKNDPTKPLEMNDPARRKAMGRKRKAAVIKPLPPMETNPKGSVGHSHLTKYVKMLKMKVPRQSVMNKMSQEGLHPELITECEAMLAKESVSARTPEATSAIDPRLLSAGEPSQNQAPPPKAKLDPALKKYVKMIKMRVPRQSIINRMKQDGISEQRFGECEAFVEGKPIPKTEAPKQVETVAVELDESLKKYVKMLKMNIPRQSVLNKMKQDGLSEDRILECEAFIAGKPIVKKSKIDVPAKPKKKKEAESKYRNSKMWASIHQLGTKKGFELETSVFSRKKTQAKQKVKKKPKPKTKKAICLIGDPKKQQKLQFFQASLKRDKISLQDLQKSLWSLECSRFDIESLLSALPDEAEMDCVRGFSQSYELLDSASQLYFFLKNIPEVKSRTELLLYSQNFDSFAKKYEDHTLCVQNAIDGISNSTGLRMMFHMILKILQINDKNGRFKDGFPLRSLYTVCKRKLVDENMTWLQYIVNMFQTKDPVVLQFVTELRPLLKGSEKFTNLDALGKDINTFALQLRRIKGFLKRYKKPKVDPGSKDNFVSFFTKFLARAEASVQKLQQAFDKVVEDCKLLAQDLGEPPMNEKKINTAYIGTISTFVDETKKAAEKLQRSQEKIRRRARLKAREQAKKKNKGKKRTVDQVAELVKVAPVGEESTGVMDRSLKKIKENTKEIRKTKAPSGYARSRGLTMDGTNDARAELLEAYRMDARNASKSRPSKSKQSIDDTPEELPGHHGKRERASIDMENQTNTRHSSRKLPRHQSDFRLIRGANRRKADRDSHSLSPHKMPGHRKKLSINDLRCLDSVDLKKMRRKSRAQKLSCSFNPRDLALILQSDTIRGLARDHDI